MKIRPWVVASCALAAPAAAFSPISAANTRRNLDANPKGITTSILRLALNTPEVAEVADVAEPEVQPQRQEFVNNGPMAWMQQFLDLAGVVPGQTIAYGPFTTGAVKESERTPAQEAARLRAEASQNLQNIDMEERNRRRGASEIMTVATILYAVWAALLGDQGDLAGHVLRFGTIFPLFLAVGYRLSADTGL